VKRNVELAASTSSWCTDAEEHGAGAGIRADDRPGSAFLDEAMRLRSKPLMHDFEGIGETSTHYIDLATSDVTPVQVPSAVPPAAMAEGETRSSSLPFLVGVKKPAEASATWAAKRGSAAG